MAENNQETEPIIVCNSGTQCTDMRFGALAIHDFTTSTGVAKILAPECSIFLIDSPVTVTDVWEGQRQLQHSYECGDLIFLPAGTEVRAAYVSNAYSETMVRIPDSLIRAVAGDILETYASAVRYTAVSHRDSSGVTAAVRNMARSGVDGPLSALLVESMSVALVAAMLGPLSTRVTTEAAHGLSRQRLQMAIDYVDANLAKDIRLVEVAAAAALSTFHFVRAFKSSMGITPVRYIWQRRVDRAKWMLRAPGASVVEVALACGFSSQSHFTTVFRRATGMTPAAYRRAAI